MPRPKCLRKSANVRALKYKIFIWFGGRVVFEGGQSGGGIDGTCCADTVVVEAEDIMVEVIEAIVFEEAEKH